MNRRSLLKFLAITPVVAIGSNIVINNREEKADKLSLTDITQATRQMLYLQLYRSQFPIDAETVAEALGIPYFGDGKTTYRRRKDEQRSKEV